MDIYGGDAKTIQPGPARRRYPEKNHTDDIATTEESDRTQGTFRKKKR